MLSPVDWAILLHSSTSLHRTRVCILTELYIDLMYQIQGLRRACSLAECWTIIRSTQHFTLLSPPHTATPHSAQGLHWKKVVESGPLHLDAPQDPRLQVGQDKVWITRSSYNRKKIAHLLSCTVYLLMNLVELRITFRNVHTAVKPTSVLSEADWETPGYKIPDSGTG